MGLVLCMVIDGVRGLVVLLVAFEWVVERHCGVKWSSRRLMSR